MMHHRKWFLTILLALSLTGCASTGGSRWYAPATWFSHGAADKVDKASAKVAVYQDDAVKLAQKAAHETQVALLAAPVSRPVDVAVASNDTAVALLDQSQGSLPVADVAAIRVAVQNLLSDNAEIRAKAEKDRAVEATNIAKISSKLSDAVTESRTANNKLRTAYDRENALANDLRSAHALHWILGGVAVLAAAGWFYIRFFLGGVPNAIGSAIASIERKSPSLADELRTHLDSALNRHEQKAVATAYIKAR